MFSPAATGFSKAKIDQSTNFDIDCLARLPSWTRSFTRLLRVASFDLAHGDDGCLFADGPRCFPFGERLPPADVHKIRRAAGFCRVLGSSAPLHRGQESLFAGRVTRTRAHCRLERRKGIDHVESALDSASASASRLPELYCGTRTLALAPFGCALRML